jgi:LmbE family N-acetylglucosaminyl deacetylase
MLDERDVCLHGPMKAGVFVRTGLLLALASLFLAPARSTAKSIMVFGPHPDDEVLIAAGVTRTAVNQGDTVKIVIVTNGDYYGEEAGLTRQAEAVAAAEALGLTEDDVIFLGYPDGSMRDIYEASSGSEVFVSMAGLSETYGARGLGGEDYHHFKYGVPGPYSRDTVLSDFVDVLTEFAPDEVYSTLGPSTEHFDAHPDHEATGRFLLGALQTLRASGSALRTRAFCTFVWGAAGSWPDDLGLGFTPLRPYTAPANLDEDWITSAEWAARLDLPVPPEMLTTDSDPDSPTYNLKLKALAAHESQGAGSDSWFLSHVRPTEFFWEIDYCAGGACTGSLPNGAACTVPGQCASSACVDGYCCSSSCGAQCQACDVPGRLGTCTTIAGAPHGTRTACAGDGSVCDGTCDGSDPSACAYPPASTLCRAASCTGGVASLAATCDGAGACPAVQSQACDPYLCGENACLTSCGSDADCVSADYCAGGTCTPRKATGAACTAVDQCASGNCVDGRCCNSTCAGQCQACDVAGHLGACTPVIGSPHGTRAACASDGSTCGGACNGSTTTACAYPGAATACRGASCTAGVATLAASCIGTGACPAAATQLCNPYVCGATACLTGCASDAACISGDYCGGGVCRPKKANGATCDADNQCTTGKCVDGYCCNSSCSAQCQACDVPGHLGACTPVTGAPHNPRAACASDGSVCGGSCDGSTTAACAYPGASTACRDASCAGGVATLPASCNGAGRCPAIQTQECSPFVCGTTACLGDCARDEDCTVGDFCAGGVCTATRDDGAACTSPNQCASGNCADGYCCDAACGGQCQACDVAGHLGTCSPVTGNPHGARTACASDGSTCGGSCNGSSTDACAYPGTDISCRTASCADGVATLSASCSGAGACPPVQTQECSPYVCGATACLGDCDGDEDCTSDRFCSGGVCAPKLANGVACAGANQCTSDSCVDGYCCDGACDGQCQACDVTDHLGACTPVLGEPHGDRAACATDGAGCKGTCDGADADACFYPSTCGQEPTGGGGGGGCSSGGGATPWCLALAALVVPVVRRRRGGQRRVPAADA